MKNSSITGKSSGISINSPTQRNVSTQLLTETQLAEHWNISIKTLQAQRWKGGGITFIKIGRSVRYSIEDVIAFEQQNSVTFGAI